MQSQASKAAPSQRGNTAFNFVVSLHPLQAIQEAIQHALQQLNQTRPYPIEFQSQSLQEGDIDERDPLPGGDGFIIAFMTRDKRAQQMIGWVRVMREFDSPILEEAAQRGIHAEKAYVVKFDRGQGDPLAFRTLHKAIVDLCPPDLLIAR